MRWIDLLAASRYPHPGDAARLDETRRGCHRGGVCGGATEAALLALLMVMQVSQVQALESGADRELMHVTIAVGGKAGLHYLPLTIAQQLGYFRDEGIAVEISDFAGGSKSIEALIGGSADMVCGGYEHVIRLQGKGGCVSGCHRLEARATTCSTSILRKGASSRLTSRSSASAPVLARSPRYATAKSTRWPTSSPS